MSSAVQHTKQVRKRRPRDPAATREAILEAASSLISKLGLEGVSLSAVAHLAGVNRGTAYQHFETREKLIEATVEHVSHQMFHSVFGDPKTIGERRVDEVDVADVTNRLVSFAMENPELCRIWLVQLLASPDPSADPFWREYEGSMERFAQTDLAREKIDVEALAVLMLSGAFLWPVWGRSHARNEAERKVLAQRFTRESLRLCMFGSMKPEKFPELARRLQETDDD